MSSVAVRRFSPAREALAAGWDSAAEAREGAAGSQSGQQGRRDTRHSPAVRGDQLGRTDRRQQDSPARVTGRLLGDDDEYDDDSGGGGDDDEGMPMVFKFADKAQPDDPCQWRL